MAARSGSVSPSQHVTSSQGPNPSERLPSRWEKQGLTAQQNAVSA
jgi:hypothetical protein